VLAAGYSSRMNAFKPLLDVGGKLAIERVIEILRDGGVSEIVIVTGHGREKLLPYISGVGVFEAFNPDYDQGMFSSVIAGIKRLTAVSKDKLKGFLLMPVDYAAVSPDIVKSILDNESIDSAFVVPCYNGKKGHPLWIPAVVIEEILFNSGATDGLKNVTMKHEENMVRIETGKESVVMDMDTPEDYADMLAYWARGCEEEDIRKLAAGRRIILIRHGQIRQHEKKIFLGQSDIPLSEFGKEQAKEAALKVQALCPQTSVMYCSDLLRAKETADIISSVLECKEVVPIKAFREMSLGSWDGAYIDDIKSKFPLEFERRGKQLLTYKCDRKAENFYDLQYRTVNALKKILKSDIQKDVVIVAHAGTIRMLAAALSGAELNEDALKTNIELASVRVIGL
ncbi:MAG: histidine phosphatase family protein, partial [Clostridiales bacterium]|nr:histidine phosphatase family protein [Clostridiales bacterium]